MSRKGTGSLAWIALFLSTTLLSAQESTTPTQPTASATAPVNDTDALAKATQNPVASLISVPLQNNSNFNVGPYHRTQDIFNIQPVIPKRISENWMLITRIIQPIVWQPYTTEPAGGQVGIGDMNPTSFFRRRSPAN